MKAKIIAEPKTVLLWNCQEQFEPLAKLCRQYGLEPKAVTGGDAGKTIGFLCGFRSASQLATLLYLDNGAYPPAMVISGLERGKVSGFVDAVNRVGSVPLKALVTLQNRDWTLAALLAELMEEHTLLGGKK